MSTPDDKTLKPTPANKQISISRVISAGYEQKGTTDDSQNPKLTSPSEPKTKLNLSALPYKPKENKVPSLAPTTQPFIPKSYGAYQPQQPYMHPMNSLPPMGRGTPAPGYYPQGMGYMPPAQYPGYHPQSGYPGYMTQQAASRYHHATVTPMNTAVNSSTMAPPTPTNKLNPNAKEFVPKGLSKSMMQTEEQKPKLMLNKDAKPYQPYKNKIEKEEKKETSTPTISGNLSSENKSSSNGEQKEIGKEVKKEEPKIEGETKKEEVTKKEEETKKEEPKKEENPKKEEIKETKQPEQKENIKISKLAAFLDNDIKESESVVTATPKSTVKPTHKKNPKLDKEKQREEKRQLLVQLKKKEEEEREKELRMKQQKEKEEREERERQKRLEAEEKARQEAQRTIIERNYFIVKVNKTETENKKRVYDLDYMNSFKSWKICNETKLLSKMVLEHIEDFKTFDDEFPKDQKGFSKGSKYDKKNESYRNDKRRNNNDDRRKGNDTFARGESAVTPVNDMQQWGRKDISNEIKLAEQFKEKLEEIKKTDPVKFDLTELLNMLTIDNYEQTKKLIFDKIKDNVEYQIKLLDVLFQKAVHEKAFVIIYAKLCKELDKELPQKVDKGPTQKKATSIMRSKLLDKCREIFKIENNEKIDEYVKVKDPDEREIKVKKFILGNVNFIGELINIQLLSKKIVFQCIDNLFKRFEKEEGDDKLRLINLEAIVILTDKFGTLINKQKTKIKPEDLKDFTSKVDNIMAKLDTVQKEANLPGYIKYKIINLIEKKKAGWEETQFEKNIIAKGKEEVRKQYEESQKKTGKGGKKLDQEGVNDKVREDLSEWRDFIEDGGKVEKYPWEIITDLYSNKQNSLAEILIGFIETCIDFVGNDTKLQYANQYWEELIKYYGPRLDNDEKGDIIANTMELVSNINDLALDNNLLLDVWANILYTMNYNQTMQFKQLDKLHDLYDENLKSIFIVIKKIIEMDESTQKILEGLSLVKDNQDVYDSVDA